ncbi:MAG: hypothetical protein NTZ97_03135 [Candidatus Moranbacteria bacterium]|nr:hypothetical protein [Candidatus Moranbacteria bacterium]
MDINLKTTPADNSDQGDRKTLYFIGGTILIIALIYFGLMFSVNLVKQQTEELNAQIKVENDKLAGNKGIKVADFQKRMDTSKSLVLAKDLATESLMKTEALIVDGSYLDLFSFDKEKGTVAVECVVTNFNISAKQILNFRNSDYFAGFVSGVQSSIEKDGKVRTKMELKIK